MVLGSVKNAADEGKKKTSMRDVQYPYPSSPLHSQFEEELDRIRTEGDLALINVQTERKKLVEIEAKLAEVTKQLRERKKVKQGKKDIVATKGAKNPFASLVSAELGSGKDGEKQLSSIPMSVKTPTGSKRGSVKVATSDRLLQTEERWKVAIGERAVELQKLRHEIDETRRKRLDALASEKGMLKDIREAEEDIVRSQTETAQLKQQAADLKNEIAEVELEFDTEKQAFRVERQRLLMELDEIMKSEKQGPDTPAPVTHRYSMFHNIARRKKHVRPSKWKKVNMEQKFFSFEQKKRLLDRIVEETHVKNMSEFIEKYNVQERIKADVFARIEANTATNASLNESIAQLTEDITRLSGVGDGDSPDADDTEKPSVLSWIHLSPVELQKLLDIGYAHIKRWVKNADIFAEAVKLLRDPIYDLHKEFFPNEKHEDILENTTPRELGMLRRIGAIEERVMQFIMAKILEETGSSSTPNTSDTLRRLRQYQGRREQRESATLTSTTLDGVEPPSTMNKNGNSPRKETKGVTDDDDDDDDDDPAREVTVMHSDAIRQKLGGIASESINANATALATTGVSPRKNAVMTLNL